MRSPLAERKKNPAMAWGKGKFEVLELKPEINSLLAKGKNFREIHKELTESGKLKVVYSTFAGHVSGFSKSDALEATQPGQKEGENNPPLNPQAPATPAKKKKKNPSSNHEPPKFVYNRNVDLDYLLSPADGSKPKEESEQ